MRKYKNILFDLDGTITDSGPGIMKSVRYALEKFDITDTPEETLRKFVGPSLDFSFRTYIGMNPEDATKAVEYYREYYPEKGIFDSILYNGIVDVFKSLHDDGCQIVLVTAKPQVFAEKIMTHFDLNQYFCYQTGTTLSNTSSDKSSLINRAVDDLGINKKDTVMIGDTRFDIEGATKAGVSNIAVTYGYGTIEELKKAGATCFADSPRQILEFI